MPEKHRDRRDAPDTRLDWLERLATRVTIGVYVSLVVLGALRALLA